MELTVIVEEVLYENYVVLGALSDGRTIQAPAPMGKPSDYIMRSLKYTTEAKFREILRNDATLRVMDAGHRLHLDKTRRLGANYAARGY